jgi:hypothetical protein
VAEWTSATAPGSPVRADGPYGRVVRFVSSDAVTSQAQADAAASAALVGASMVGRAETVTAVPDPSFELGDVGQVNTRDGLQFTGRLSTVVHPLTPDDGAMAVTVSNVPVELG